MSYRSVLSANPRTFYPLAAVARWPYAMAPLATLLLVTHSTGSVGFAGAAAGAQSLAVAAGGVLVGRAADRWGLRLIGAVATVLDIVAVAGLIGCASGPRPLVLAAAVIVGASQPQVGPLVRVHWSGLASDGVLATAAVPSALAYEAGVDEIGFVVGPALVGLLGFVSPAAPMWGAVVLLAAASLPLTRYYRRAPRGPRARPCRPVPLPVAELTCLVLAMVVVGGVFGVLQTALTEHGGRGGSAGSAGLLYALLGVGSAVAGLASTRPLARMTIRTRYLVVSVGYLTATLVLACADVVVPVPVAVLVAGLGIAPYMITVYVLAERLVPARAGTVIAAVCAGGPVGTALGQSTAGWVIALSATSGQGFSRALCLCPVLAVGAVLLAVAGRLTRSDGHV